MKRSWKLPSDSGVLLTICTIQRAAFVDVENFGTGGEQVFLKRLSMMRRSSLFHSLSIISTVGCLSIT